MNNLLVIDWDYFFPRPDLSLSSYVDLNPTGRDADDQFSYVRTAFLYDWGHQESDLFINAIWTVRAAEFRRMGLDLPTIYDRAVSSPDVGEDARFVYGWREFRERFKLAANARLYVADSNTWAGALLPDGNVDGLSDAFTDDQDRFDSVWLYDAHHDSGYSVKSVENFITRGHYNCEDWMLIHQLRGSELHWRYPRWLDVKYGSPKTRGLELEWQRDGDNNEPDVEFTDVFVCRSGAWVPPWCDDDFTRFVSAFENPLRYRPVEESIVLEDISPRHWDENDVTKQVEMIELAMKMLGPKHE